MEHGVLLCTQRGDRVELYLDVKGGGNGLYRGIILGRSGQLDLGTLLPEGGRLRLRRTLPVEQLHRKGCWPIIGAKTELRYAFGENEVPTGWTRMERMEELFTRDILLSRAARDSNSGLLQKQETGEFNLAFPWDPHRPFPLLPVFCFARVEKFSGRSYVVVSFRADETPYMPEG